MLTEFVNEFKLYSRKKKVATRNSVFKGLKNPYGTLVGSLTHTLSHVHPSLGFGGTCLRAVAFCKLQNGALIINIEVWILF